MTDATDPINAYIDAYIDYLDAGSESEPPSLDGLDTADRAQAQAVIENLRGGRMFDPSVSPPSLESTLFGTPFFDAVFGTDHPDEDLKTVQSCVQELRPWNVEVRLDETTTFGSTFLVSVNGQRLRAQVRHDAHSAADLHDSELIASARRIYGQHPETLGVALICPDSDLSCVVVDPFDSEQCIEVPSGNLVRARSRRTIQPLALSIRAYMNEVFPIFPAISRVRAEALPGGLGDVPIDELVRRHARDIAKAGQRAQTEMKRATWSAIDAHEIGAVSKLVHLSTSGPLDPAAFETWLGRASAVKT